MKKVALISTPWPLFNRPSIQLASLKAFLKQKIPELEIDNLHIYLRIAYKIGYEVYNKISDSSWLSESIYAWILYPEKRDAIKKLWKKLGKKILADGSIELEKLCELVKRESELVINQIDWSKYFLAGFSICFSQLTSSIYFLKEIKERFPELKIVVGGSCCSAEMGESLKSLFKEIDYVIQGEGEIPLYNLVSSLLKGEEPDISPAQITDLNSIPVPDYSDYFRQAKEITKGNPFQAKLPLEISRGCWWGKCAFCNLNIQWKGYRVKSAKKVAAEIDELVKRYQLLSISFMDNLIPASSEALFNEIHSLGKDLRMFSEIRADTPLKSLILMGKAGMKEVQVGIEALSSRLLKKMKKGTSAIQNIEIMKNCEADGMPKLVGNMILQFPGSDEKDVEETMRNLDFVFPFSPLKGIPFWLGYCSYVWRNPKKFGIKISGNHSNYSCIFPEGIVDRAVFMIQGYKGQIREQKRLWKPVQEKIKEWKKFYDELHSVPKSEPILSYQDGGDFLIIRHRISKQKTIVHKLKGLSRRIYLFCERNRSISEILLQFPSLDSLKLVPFLRMMVDKKVMFSEGDRYLSLAVPANGWRHLWNI